MSAFGLHIKARMTYTQNWWGSTKTYLDHGSTSCLLWLGASLSSCALPWKIRSNFHGGVCSLPAVSPFYLLFLSPLLLPLQIRYKLVFSFLFVHVISSIRIFVDLRKNTMSISRMRWLYQELEPVCLLIIKFLGIHYKTRSNEGKLKRWWANDIWCRCRWEHYLSRIYVLGDGWVIYSHTKVDLFDDFFYIFTFTFSILAP